jgi:hypothetical protein
MIKRRKFELDKARQGNEVRAMKKESIKGREKVYFENQFSGSHGEAHSCLILPAQLLVYHQHI